MNTTTQYTQLPSDIGTLNNPVRLPFNVPNYHIKKTADKKDFVLGNTIVTDRYASSICMITNIVPNKNQADTFKVTLHDGTDEFTYNGICKSKISPEVWAKVYNCSLDDANKWIKDSTLSSDVLPHSLSHYRTSPNYPIIVEFVFQLGIHDDRTCPQCYWHSCKLFADYALPEKKITKDSEEWHNIIWKENIEKGATFYKDYCLTSSQRLSLQTNTFHPPYGYHPILDNPCYPIPMTRTNMWEDIKQTRQQQDEQQQQQQSKLFYYGREITCRLAYTTVYVDNNPKPCRKTPKCSADCTYALFKDNSKNDNHTIGYHLAEYLPKGSTCIDFSRLDVDLGFKAAGPPILLSTIGKEGYRNRALVREHQAKALQVIEDVETINIQYKKYVTSLNVQYNTYIEQIKHFYSHLSTHPVFATLIEPLQKQLEDAMATSKEQRQECDTPQSLYKLLDWNNTTSDLLLQCKQIIKEYIESVKIHYDKHTEEQIKHYYTLITAHLSTHPLFSTLIESLQKQLESALLTKPKEHQQFDTIEELNGILDWYNTMSDLSLNCEQIIDTLLNTNIALYNDFYEYYLPHLDEQLHHLQQQMQLISSSNNNNTNTIYPIPQSPATPNTQTSSSSTTLFNYQRNVIRPVAQYRHRAHVVPPSSSSILLSSHRALFNSIMTSHNDNDNNSLLLSSQHHPTLFSQSSSSDTHSLAQQHTLEVSLARQQILAHAIDYEHALLDIKDDEITELKQQIKTLQETTQLLSSSVSSHTNDDVTNFKCANKPIIDPETCISINSQQHDRVNKNDNNNSHIISNDDNVKHTPLLHDIAIYKQQLDAKDKQLELQHNQLEQQHQQLQQQHQQLEAKDKQLEAKDKQLEQQHQHYTSELESKDKQLEAKDKQLDAKDKQIQLLLQMLADKS